MRITLLELVEFNCLMLNNIQHLKFKPTELYQLILGTNGSGKSSVMDQLTPWPGDPNEFAKNGGFKAIEIVDRGNKYRLETQYRGKAHYSFVKNEEELNPGGTSTVQKELVEQEFRINQNTHELVMGREKFTDMKPNERRVWLTRLSEVNYDFAIDLFKKLSTRLRDTQGSLRRNKTRLVTETEKIITVEEEKKLEADLHELELELERLNSLHNPQFGMDARRSVKWDECNELIARTATRILKMQVVGPEGNQCSSVEDIDAKLSEIAGRLKVAEYSLGQWVKDHDRITKIVTALRQTGEEGLAQLQAKVQPLREARDSFYSRQRLKLVVSDPFGAARALETVGESLDAIFRELPANEDRRYSQGRLTQLREEAQQHRNDLENLRKDLAKAVAKQQHADAHRNSGSTACPKCHHVWVQGFSEKMYEENADYIAEIELGINHREGLLANVDDNIQKVTDYANVYREFTRVVQTWPILKPFWDYLLQEKVVIDAPGKAIGLISIFTNDLLLCQEAANCESQLEELQTLISNAAVAGDSNLEEALDDLATADAAVDECTANVVAIRREQSLYSGFKTQVLSLIKFGTELEGLMSSLSDQTEGMIDELYYRTLKGLINDTQSTLVRKREAVQNVRIQRATVRSLEKQVEDDLLDEASTAILVKELSPTEGLIAEGLLGFIRNFTGQMNHLIHKIWTYPLQVFACGGDSDTVADLDYRFPMMVSARTNIVPDIKKGSSGQKEIVNLAFKVVAMRYLGLENSPLYLDEFGASFDEAHRTSAMQTIKNLMEQQSFTQMFMVSHYEGNHGSLTNAEVFVICPQNITVPAKYNQHVDIL